VNEFQIDLHSGLFVLRQTDLFVPDLMPLVLTRTYRPCSSSLGLLGCAATDMSDSAGHHIRLNRDAVRTLKQLVSPSGHVINFKYDAANRIAEASDDSGTINGAECDRHEKCSGDSARTADNPRALAD
jgi:hypothetical protein